MLKDGDFLYFKNKACLCDGRANMTPAPVYFEYLNSRTAAPRIIAEMSTTPEE